VQRGLEERIDILELRRAVQLDKVLIRLLVRNPYGREGKGCKRCMSGEGHPTLRFSRGRRLTSFRDEPTHRILRPRCQQPAETDLAQNSLLVCLEFQRVRTYVGDSGTASGLLCLL
jgi:hypothetical protein